MKVYKHVVQGLETKFKGFGDTKYPLNSFGFDISKHLKEDSMEVVFTLNNKQEIHNLITHHFLFTLHDVK